jgi:hypothetical protein
MAPELKAGITLYFARHGQTVANVERRFQGRNDTPLTEHGRMQARMLAAILAEFLAGQTRPRFVSSRPMYPRSAIWVMRAPGLPGSTMRTRA